MFLSYQIVQGSTVCVTDCQNPKKQYYGRLETNIEEEKSILVAEAIKGDEVIFMKTVKINKLETCYHVQGENGMWYIVQTVGPELSVPKVPINLFAALYN